MSVLKIYSATHRSIQQRKLVNEKINCTEYPQERSQKNDIFLLAGGTEVAAMLIEKGADVNDKSTGGYTPLHQTGEFSSFNYFQ